jgi:mannose-6-phosphate isomerase-like protein (cupin superfamily)
MDNRNAPFGQPQALGPEEGPTFWVLGLRGQAKATGSQTGGQFSLVEALCPPGYATPLHIHYLEDEAIYVLEGRLSVLSRGRTVAVACGGYIYQPRGIAHGFRVDGQVPARILCLTVPASANQGPPPGEVLAGLPGPAALAVEKLAELAARYKIEVLGPLPETPAAGTATPGDAPARRPRAGQA